MERLINIELAHVSLIKEGCQSGCDWILILEDDAHAGSISELADSLARFIMTMEQTTNLGSQPQYVNLSRSFSETRLGVTTLMTHAGHWSAGAELLASSKPVTNTVCAVLYRREFAERLLTEFESIPLSPVLPIDWKLNLAIMRLFDLAELGPGDYWTVNPAPILQGSMHSH